MNQQIRALVCGIAILPAMILAADLEAKPAATPADSSKSVQKPAKTPLERGMSAARIIELIGKPQEVKPQPTPKDLDGTVEIWIYRQTVETKSIQVPTGEREILVFGGIGQGDANMMKTAKEFIYTLKHVTIYRVTSLLLVNGSLVVAKQTMEESEAYD